MNAALLPFQRFLAFAVILSATHHAVADARAWTDSQGRTIEAEYVSSTAENVVIRRSDGQALRIALSDLSEDDRTFVAQRQAAEREANMIEVVIKGEIIWRLPAWRSLGWSNRHSSEIWLWDEKARKATEKVATVEVNYTSNYRSRNQFEGVFKTEGAVRIPKDAWLIVKAQFNPSVNGEPRALEQWSSPMSLPAVKDGESKLPAVRHSITR